MWKNIINLLIISILFGFIYFIMYKNFNLKLEDSVNKNKSLQQQNELLKNCWLETLIASEAKLNHDIQLFFNEDKCLLTDIVKEKTLVVKITYTACQPCLQRELKNIASFEIKGIPVIIIAAYPNIQIVQSLLKEHTIQSKAFLIHSNQDVLALDESFNSSIYMFLMDKDLSFRYLFFPIQAVDDVSEMYFKFIETAE